MPFDRLRANGLFERTARRSAGRRVVLKGLDALPERGAVSFALPGGFPRQGFVIKIKGELRAFVNRCPHAGTTLDFGDDDFFTEDGRWLRCKTHGALYEPAGGACAGGPCGGQGLEPLALTRGSRGTHQVRLANSEGT